MTGVAGTSPHTRKDARTHKQNWTDLLIMIPDLVVNLSGKAEAALPFAEVPYQSMSEPA
jgi:hypothetical protein